VNLGNADHWKCELGMLQSSVYHQVAGGRAIAKMGSGWSEVQSMLQLYSLDLGSLVL
jgi:hypothetical protein